MASDRLDKDKINTFPLPGISWYFKKASYILNQPVVSKNIDSPAINEKLMENIKEEGILNPILCASTWWPIVGSQRLKAIYEIRKQDKNFDPLLKIAKIDKPVENIFYLWPEKEFANKAVAIQYQLWELVFKSTFFDVEKTKSGEDVKYYETLGDQLTGWKYDKLPN